MNQNLREEQTDRREWVDSFLPKTPPQTDSFVLTEVADPFLLPFVPDFLLSSISFTAKGRSISNGPLCPGII